VRGPEQQLRLHFQWDWRHGHVSRPHGHDDDGDDHDRHDDDRHDNDGHDNDEDDPAATGMLWPALQCANPVRKWMHLLQSIRRILLAELALTLAGGVGS
jgi:hypothetical protein